MRTMNNFIGTVEDFINENDYTINKFILEKIGEQESIKKNIIDEDYKKQKFIDIKNKMKNFFFKEFGNWEIALDLETFKNSFDYNL